MSLDEVLAERALWNPYDFANPVNDQALFAGRERELGDIEYYLTLAGRAPRPINLVLTGPRSAGKTSLLNWILSSAVQKGYCVARVELNEGDANPLALFYKIYDAIIMGALKRGCLAGIGGTVHNRYRTIVDGATPDGDGNCGGLIFPRHFASASTGSRLLSEPTFVSDLALIHQELDGPCVVLFDECDVLNKSRVELEMLRNVFMNTPGYMLVFAGTANLFPLMEEVFSPIIRQFKKIAVEHFPGVKETQTCIEKPLLHLGIDPTQVLKPNPNTVARDIHKLSNGRPYEIQLLCHFMFRRVEEGRSRDLIINLDLLDEVRRELENQELGSDRRSIQSLHDLRREDLDTLRALTLFQGTLGEYALHSHLFSPVPLDLDTLRESSARFQSLGLLTIQDDEVSFAGDQFDEIYARYFAAARDTPLNISKLSFQRRIYHSLLGLLWVCKTVEVIDTDFESIEDTREKLADFLVAVTGSPQDGASLLESSAEFYQALLQAPDRGRLTLGRVTLDVAGASTSMWVVLTAEDSAEFLGESSLQRLSERCEATGGALRVEFHDLDMPDRSVITSNVQAIAPPKLLARFAYAHSAVGYKSFSEGKYELSLANYKTALEMQPSASHSTPCAHLSLACGSWDEAIGFAAISRELLIANDEIDFSAYALASYDMAVGLLGIGAVAEAAVVLEEAKDALTHGRSTSAYLAIPEPRSIPFSVELTDHIDLSETISSVQDLIQEGAFSRR